MRKLMLAILCAAGWLDLAHAQQASFDCGKARAPDEIAICSDVRLSELDRLGAAAFGAARRRPGSHDLIAGAQAILLARIGCRSNKACILDRQIAALSLYRNRGIPVEIPAWAPQYQAELAGAPGAGGNVASSPTGTILQKCLLEVNDVHYIGGPCNFTAIDRQGSFRISDIQGRGIVAQVMSTAKDEGSASWNGPIGGVSKGVDLGAVYHGRQCWEGDRLRICAWALDAPMSVERTPPEPKSNEVVYSGSRVGMYEDIVSQEGLNSAHAIIRTRPSRNGAITYCRQYGQDYSLKCIDDFLAAQGPNTITANCPSGQFVDFLGQKFQFLGKNSDYEPGTLSPKYLIMKIESSEMLIGDMASGYNVEGDIFKALCPAVAPPDF